MLDVIVPLKPELLSSSQGHLHLRLHLRFHLLLHLHLHLHLHSD